MKDQETLLVVLDPNDDIHVAFERAVLTAPLRSNKPRIHILVTTDREAVDTGANNPKLYRNTDWFDETIRNPLAECGLAYEIEVCWSRQWRQSILATADRIDAAQIYLPMHNKPYGLRLTFSDSTWELLKSAHCPVVLVRPDTRLQRRSILAAVNFQATSPEQKTLNRKILERGHWLADIYGAELFIVNGYMDSMHYPDRGKLARESRLPSDRIHVQQGYTDRVVAEVADTINADLVVLGTLGQNGRQNNRRGNTAERVISAIKVDAVIINA